jgi:hypothetical protein
VDFSSQKIDLMRCVDDAWGQAKKIARKIWPDRAFSQNFAPMMLGIAIGLVALLVGADFAAVKSKSHKRAV